jgi:hypothetical protein
MGEAGITIGKQGRKKTTTRQMINSKKPILKAKVARASRKSQVTHRKSKLVTPRKSRVFATHRKTASRVEKVTKKVISKK